MPESSPGGRRRTLGGRLRRWFATPEQREAEDMAELARECGAHPIAGARERSRVVFVGEVVQIGPSPATGWLEAELTDGTGSVTLVWMGRRQLEAVTPGTHLRVAGRLASDGGRLVVFNPDYDVVS